MLRVSHSSFFSRLSHADLLDCRVLKRKSCFVLSVSGFTANHTDVKFGCGPSHFCFYLVNQVLINALYWQRLETLNLWIKWSHLKTIPQ